MQDWSVFVPYTGLHLTTVIVCFSLIALAIYAGRQAPTAAAERQLRHAIAWFGLIVWVAYNTAWNWNGIDLHEGLPLQLCDVGGIVAPLALLTLHPWLRAALYFWTFTLTIQAFIQPTVTQGPASPLFWGFWAAHTIIVGCAVYDLIVLRFRPQWADLKRAYAVSGAYVAAVLPVNLMIGANYGFVGNPPDDRPIPPFVAMLGPWPGRAVILVGLAGLAFLLVLLPWLGRPQAVGTGNVTPDLAGIGPENSAT